MDDGLGSSEYHAGDVLDDCGLLGGNPSSSAFWDEADAGVGMLY